MRGLQANTFALPTGTSEDAEPTIYKAFRHEPTSLDNPKVGRSDNTLNVSYSLSIFFLKTSGLKQLGSNAFIKGPGKYRKVGEK